MEVPLHQRLRSNVNGRDPIIALCFTLYRHNQLSKSTPNAHHYNQTRNLFIIYRSLTGSPWLSHALVMDVIIYLIEVLVLGGTGMSRVHVGKGWNKNLSCSNSRGPTWLPPSHVLQPPFPPPQRAPLPGQIRGCRPVLSLQAPTPSSSQSFELLHFHFPLFILLYLLLPPFPIITTPSPIFP